MALSGTQTTRLSVGGAGAAYSAFSPKTEAVVIIWTVQAETSTTWTTQTETTTTWTVQ